MIECDLLVIGSGGGGMSAALTAAALGADVIVVEKAAVLGGTTSYSEAMVWVPCSAQAKAAGVDDSVEAALAYVKDVADRRYDPARVRAYVERAPEMLAAMEAWSDVRYRLATGSVDYYPERPGATAQARALSPGAFDGRRLGREDFGRLRRPLGSTQLFGGMTVASSDLPHYYRVFRSLTSTVRVAQLFMRYLADRLTGWPRGAAIANGDGVVAAMLLALRARGGRVITQAAAQALVVEEGRVTGAKVLMGGAATTIRARRGVVLATGGFSADPAKRARYAPDAQRGGGYVTLTAEGATGDGLEMAEAIGGVLRQDVDQPLAWAPSSWVPHLNSGFPHFMERAKPGIIVVDRRGHRFVNEATVYHDFVPAMIQACREDPLVEAYIIADSRAQRRYGLGAAPPAPASIKPSLRSGYLLEAGSLDELAQKLGIDEKALAKTVAEFNSAALKGDDADFGRGVSAQNKAYGDPTHSPNPCLGPLDQPPFYAVRLHPGDLGSFVGLATDEFARVLDEHGAPLEGLYAVGLDAASVLGGHYPAAGVTVGSAMTFGYIAAKHAITPNG